MNLNNEILNKDFDIVVLNHKTHTPEVVKVKVIGIIDGPEQDPQDYVLYEHPTRGVTDASITQFNKLIKNASKFTKSIV